MGQLPAPVREAFVDRLFGFFIEAADVMVGVVAGLILFVCTISVDIPQNRGGMHYEE